MFLILPIIGILAALAIGDSANRGFDVIVGAIVGYLFADLGIIRGELKGLRKTLEQLTADPPWREFRVFPETGFAFGDGVSAAITSVATAFN